mgnify:CR=1 FL=1
MKLVDRNVLRAPGLLHTRCVVCTRRLECPGKDHALTFRWEVFNRNQHPEVDRIQRPLVLQRDPFIIGGQAPVGFGNMTATRQPLLEKRRLVASCNSRLRYSLLVLPDKLRSLILTRAVVAPSPARFF